MKTKLLFASILGVGLAVSSLIVTNGAFAQTTPNTIQYPIAELGNCKSRDACKAYCDDPSHINACVAYAEKTGIMSQNQLAEAKQVQVAVANGVQPPACNSKEACDAYCEEPSHMKECITFGEVSGFLKGKELEDAKKMIVAIDNGATPPACKGKEACDAYCSDRDHIEECMTFAQAAGLMTPEEAQNSQKMIAAVKKGFKPPNCKGREECDAYCAAPAHTDECIQFSLAAGFMTEEQAEMAKRTGGKGPGGCVSKDSCDAFCNNSDNQQTCFNFAKDNGLISAEEATYAQEGQKKMQTSIQNLPADAANCIQNVVGTALFEKMKSGQAVPPKDAIGNIGTCFAKMAPRQMGPGEGGDITPAAGDQTQKVLPQGEQAPGTLAVPRIEPNEEQQRKEDQSQNMQFAPGTSANQPPPPEGQQAPGTLFVPRIEMEQKNQTLTPPDQQAPGTLFVPRVEIEQSNQATIPIAPQVEQTPPIEQTAPQSFNFDLNSSFAAVIIAFQENRF